MRIFPTLLVGSLVLLAGPASATLFPYSLVDADAVPRGRCKAGSAVAANVWPAKAGFCHDDPQLACVASIP